jgi:NAD(P)-dependent dehydrogenase (short-subunit alcohol dehydrogenase family)
MTGNNRVKGKVALVTGAASGLGLASAIKLLDEGAKVFFSDINEKGLEKLNQVLDQYDSEYYALGHHDVSSEVSWNEVLEHVNSKFGKLNILLNSAGIALGGDVVSTGFDVWKKVHDVNLDSVFLGCKLAIPMMSEHGAGSIISISSISGIVAGWNTAAYNSSKAGVRHLSKSIALYCAKKGYNIRSNTIHPAFIDTPILDPHKQAFGEKEAVAKLSRQIPMNKIGDTDDVAYAVLYLASDESKFITGSEIVLDGGLSAM